MSQLDAYQFRIFFALALLVVAVAILGWQVTRMAGKIERLEDKTNTQWRVNRKFNEEIKKLKEPKP